MHQMFVETRWTILYGMMNFQYRNVIFINESYSRPLGKEASKGSVLSFFPILSMLAQLMSKWIKLVVDDCSLQ